MERLTKYCRRIKITYCLAALVSCFIMMLFVNIFPNAAQEDGYYAVVLNGEVLGAVNSEDMAYYCMKETRLKINNEAGQIVYMEPELTVYEEKKIIGETLESTVLQEKMYEILKLTYIEEKQMAYVINVDGFTVTLSTKDEVISLLEKAIEKYNENDQFQIELTDSKGSKFTAFSPQVIQKDENSNEEVKGIEFAESVLEVIEAYVSEEEIVTLDEAVKLLTAPKETKKKYEIVAGDSLSLIAYNLDTTIDKILEVNDNLTYEGEIYIGDEINVMVMEPELSVRVMKEAKYNEEYNKDIEYVENNEMFADEETVITKGKKGERDVKVLISYVNDLEEGREIIEEDIIKEAVAKVVEIGTIEPPTYIRPLSGGYISSTFGERWGTMHKGLDFGCYTGTAIYASCGGTVTRAGWWGTYGYCVEIMHADGNRTRYAHLSQVLVEAGEKVSQYDKIALSGNTGNSEGPHLHFEILEGGVQVDPLNYLE